MSLLTPTALWRESSVQLSGLTAGLNTEAEDLRKLISPGRVIHLNSDPEILISQAEAKCLWDFLNSNEAKLTQQLHALMRRIESNLWDGLSIDEMSRSSMSGDVVHE